MRNIIAVLAVTSAGIITAGCKSLPFIGGMKSEHRCYTVATQYGSVDAFKNDPLCYDTTGLADIDAYLDKANKVAGDVRLSTILIGMGDTAETRKSVAILLTQAVENGQALVKQTPSLISSAKSQLTGPKAIHAPSVLKALADTSKNLSMSVSDGLKDMDALKKEAVAEK
jgi:hypothetical protein